MTAEVKRLSVNEVMERCQANPNLLLLDVRTDEEWAERRIPGATLISMHNIVRRLSGLDVHRETIVVCEHGIRSENVAIYLATKAHFMNVSTMVGGLSVWHGPTVAGE